MSSGAHWTRWLGMKFHRDVLRRYLERAPALDRLFGPLVDSLEQDTEGSLLFLSLRKP